MLFIEEKSKQTEYTENTPLLAPDGTLLAKGWARKNVFEYNRDYVKKGIISRKEWDFYTIADDEMQMSFASNAGNEIIDELKMLDINTLTPIEAMSVLYKFAQKAKES